MNINEMSYEELMLEIENLRVRLLEAEETLRAIRSGEIDALVVSGAHGEQVFTLKGAEKPYRILIEQMEEGAAMLDTHNSILYCNRGFARILKKPLEKIIGTKISQYVLQSGLADLQELLDFGMQESSHGETSFMAGDGTYVPVYLSITSHNIDGIAAINLVAMDLTERKRAETDLRKARDELEIRVNERTEELVKTNEMLKTEIIERKQAEEALRESEQKFMKLFQGNAAAIALTRLRDRRIIEVNERWQEVFGFSREEVIGEIVNKIKLWKHPEEQMRAIHDLETHGAFRNRECEFFRKNGEGWIGLISSEVIQLQGEVFILTSLVDITQRKRAVEALCESEARFRSVLDNSQDIIYRLNMKTCRYEYISPSAETVVGFSHDELMALDSETSLAMIHPDDLPAMRAVLARLENTGKVELEYRQRAKNGEYRWISNNMSLVKDSAGRPLYRNGNIRDITQRKRTEKALRKAHEELEQRVRERTAQLNESLEEKEILLREIHHRVKNNMQVISGLLMLQEEFSNDANISEMIKESQNRIASMALIHEKLYRSESLSKIDFKEYIDDLVGGLFESYGFTESRIGLKANAENIFMGIDIAIPVGLIINELVSNSLKHAFPEGKKGEIEISLSSTGEYMIELLVQDNGVGIPEGVDFRNTESLGLHIVNILVKNQLHGEITMNNNNGTEFMIRFRRMK